MSKKAAREGGGGGSKQIAVRTGTEQIKDKLLLIMPVYQQPIWLYMTLPAVGVVPFQLMVMIFGVQGFSGGQRLDDLRENIYGAPPPLGTL